MKRLVFLAAVAILVGRSFSFAEAADLKVGPTYEETRTHVLVIVGLAGDAEHGELFRRWAATLVDSATGRFGIPKDHVAYLAEDPAKEAPRATGKSSRDEIARAFAALAKGAAADDVVFVVLIGHGSFDGKVAKFNLPGPDMAPADFAPLLAAVPSRHLVFVNAASSSGPFVAELAAPGRTIVTATRTGAEKFATLFGGYFVDALTSETADVDRNKRVSVLEAFDAAKREVARAYEKAGTMLTEHPLLDDSGDREGSAAPTADGKNGREAALLSLGAVAAAEPAAADPKLRALYAERRELEQRVEALILKKSSMDPAQYATELEQLLTALALKSKQIKDGGGRP